MSDHLNLLSLSSKVRRNENSLSAEVDDALVLMCIERGHYYSLDTIGANIWQRLEHWIAVSELCTILGTEYDADPETIQRDILALLESLAKECLIEIKPDSTT